MECLSSSNVQEVYAMLTVYLLHIDVINFLTGYQYCLARITATETAVVNTG